MSKTLGCLFVIVLSISLRCAPQDLNGIGDDPGMKRFEAVWDLAPEQYKGELRQPAFLQPGNECAPPKAKSPRLGDAPAAIDPASPASADEWETVSKSVARLGLCVYRAYPSQSSTPSCPFYLIYTDGCLTQTAPLENTALPRLLYFTTTDGCLTQSVSLENPPLPPPLSCLSISPHHMFACPRVCL